MMIQPARTAAHCAGHLLPSVRTSGPARCGRRLKRGTVTQAGVQRTPPHSLTRRTEVAGMKFGNLQQVGVKLTAPRCASTTGPPEALLRCLEARACVCVRVHCSTQLLLRSLLAHAGGA